MSNDMNNGNGLKIALIVISVLFVISLIANGYFYTQQDGITSNGDSEEQIADLQNQIATLQTEIDDLKTPKLVTRLGADDQKPWLGTDYLHVYGSVINVGTNAAPNCRLHVVIYQGQTIAKDTYINLGTINGEGYVDVDEKVYYEGSSLTDWNITPEFD